MKKLFKLLFVFVLSFAVLFTLAACGKEEDVKEVYIIQYVSAPALDNARDGIIAGLKEAGFEDGKNIKITVMNPEAKADTLQQLAETAVQKADLIFAIATPVAQVLANEVEKQFSDVPVLFTAVTDPVVAGIIDSAASPSKNISGTSDINPVGDQVGLLKEINPSATKIGFIYTTGETNSEIQLNMAKQAAQNLGLTVEAKSATNATDIGQVLDSLLASGIDALYIPTDNEIASQMSFVSQKCNNAGIFTICGETGLLTNGGTITIGSVDYIRLGQMTGKMGAEVLNGKSAKGMPVQYFSSNEYACNKDAVAEFNLPIPKAVLDKCSDVKTAK